jgi:molybdopterin/thiamine biosynthesis adenylyltransferase
VPRDASVAATLSSDRYARVGRVASLEGASLSSLRERRALVVGCGALGSAVAAHLVRAGIGHIRIVDRDVVESRNLVDQGLFDESDAELRRPKAEAAARALASIDADTEVEGVVADYAAGNARALAKDADVLIDGADNLETKLLLNDVAIDGDTPLVYAGCAGSEGTIMAVLPRRSHCLQCLWPARGRRLEAGLSCERMGVLPGAIAATAALQFTEAMKILLGLERDLAAGLVRIDVWGPSLRRPPMPPYRGRATSCPACEDGDLAYLEGCRGTHATELCGDDTVLLTAPGQVDLDRVARARGGDPSLRVHPECVRFEAEGCRLLVFPSGRTLIHGAGGSGRARALHARYVEA